MTDPLLLRPWAEADAPTLVRLHRTNPDLSRQLPDVSELPNARAFITTTWSDRSRIFALAERGVAIGSVGVTAIDSLHSTGWFSYWIATSHAGRGLTSRAAASVATWALTPTDEGGLGLHRLELGHRVNNPASGKVAEAAGFVREGLEREKLAWDGERFDVVTMARLASDPAPTVPAIEITTD